MKAFGFDEAYDLDGSIMMWKSNEFAVIENN